MSKNNTNIIGKILGFFTIKRIFKLFCLAIAVTVIGMLFFRMYTINNYPSKAKGVIATEALSNSYASGTLNGITWDLPTDHDNAGEFFVYQPIYFEDEKTLIITVRYNDSVLEAMKHEGGGEALPLFPSLYADGTERVLPALYNYTHEYKLYSYRRYVFENVELGNYEHLYLDIHLKEAYEESPYTTLEVYNTKERTTEYKLSSADKKILAN